MADLNAAYHVAPLINGNSELCLRYFAVTSESPNHLSDNHVARIGLKIFLHLKVPVTRFYHSLFTREQDGRVDIFSDLVHNALKRRINGVRILHTECNVA